MALGVPILSLFRLEIRSSYTVGSSLAVLAAFSLAGCSSTGPSVGRVKSADGQVIANESIRVVDLTDVVARRIIENDRSRSFADAFGDVMPASTIIGPGDVLDIAIWEAPPAALFGVAVGGGGDIMQTANQQTGRGNNLPEQMVDTDGRIVVPFAGSVQASGRTQQQIARDIMARLQGVAHKPQVIVRLVRNATRSVTVVGDVANSMRVPLTAKGERLLDALAAAGGVKQPVNKTTIQIARGEQVVSEPLESIVSDPRQNIRLQADDVVTAFYQRYSFTALGATGINSELPFEGTGITLAQALGRVGGLNDQRSNPRGVFIFRMEDPAAVDPSVLGAAQKAPNGQVPVIYRIDLKDPATFFVAQTFPIRNKDVIYVSNAPIAELQKFVNIISSVVIPAITVENATSNR